MDDFIKRGEYMHGQERIHTRVDEIAKTATQIETHSKDIKQDVRDMHQCLFGNGRDGLIQKISRLFERVSLHTKIITGTVLAIIAGFIALVFKLVNN